jgi:NitT/TauT family transport system substrate-binding protein
LVRWPLKDEPYLHRQHGGNVAAKQPRQTLRLMETWHSLFYTPIYVAVAGGFLENEGLDVTFTTCPPKFPHALDALIHDGADIAQSGIMRGIIAFGWGAETVPAHIAKINARDGFFLLGRRPPEEFDLESLHGASLIPISFTDMPWASCQFGLRRLGVDPAGLKLVPGLSLDQATAAFLGGEGDFIHLPQPAAEQLLTSGQAHLAVALGPVIGHVAYSSFAATNSFLDAKPEVAAAFVRGFAGALAWIAGNDAAAVGDAVASFFPEIGKEVVVRAVARYKEQETWPPDPRLDRPEFEAQQDILIDAGLVKGPQEYERIVRPEFFQAALG